MLMIFGGETYYASGGANDFICMAEDHKAQLIAYKLLGSTVEYREEWDTEGDFTYEIIIEWVHIATQEGIVVHTFGRPFGYIFEHGIKTIKYLEK